MFNNILIYNSIYIVLKGIALQKNYNEIFILIFKSSFKYPIVKKRT